MGTSTGFTIPPIYISYRRFYTAAGYPGISLKLCAVYDEQRDTIAAICRKNGAEFSSDTDTGRRTWRINHPLS